MKRFAPRDSIVAWGRGVTAASALVARCPGVELQRRGRRETDHPIAEVGEQSCRRASTTRGLCLFGARSWVVLEVLYGRELIRCGTPLAARLLPIVRFLESKMAAWGAPLGEDRSWADFQPNGASVAP